MNRNKEFQNDLYEGLEKLLTISEAFYSDVVSMEGVIYKMYNYRLATWADYQLPYGLEARGVMFDISDVSDPILISAAPRKFFNYEQGEDLKHHLFGFGLKMEKMDGSLISTYLHKGELYLKSKMSLMSEQSNMANLFLQKNPEYKEELKRIVNMGYTVNLELISPDNQIVVPYEKTDLIILNLRSLNDGEMMYARELTAFLKKSGDFPESLKRMVPFTDLTNTVKSGSENHEEFLNILRQEVGLEGYVIEILAPTPYLVKIKNLDYINKHYLKDGMDNDRRLFEAIIDEETDDLRSVFVDDPLSLKRISEMENKIMPIYNGLIAKVEKFFKENQHLPRKDYAMKALAEKDLKKNFISSFAINTYTGKECDYKAFAKKYRREIWNIGGELNVAQDVIPAKPMKIK